MLTNARQGDTAAGCGLQLVLIAPEKFTVDLVIVVTRAEDDPSVSCQCPHLMSTYRGVKACLA